MYLIIGDHNAYFLEYETTSGPLGERVIYFLRREKIRSIFYSFEIINCFIGSESIEKIQAYEENVQEKVRIGRDRPIRAGVARKRIFRNFFLRSFAIFFCRFCGKSFSRKFFSMSRKRNLPQEVFWYDPCMILHQRP